MENLIKINYLDLERYHQLRNTLSIEEAAQAMLEEKAYQEEYEKLMNA